MLTTQTRSRLTVIILAYLTFIALGMPGGLLGVAWPSIRDNFGLTSSGLGSLLLASTIGYLLASVFNGRVVARWGVGFALLAASLLSAVGLGLFAIAPGWWIMLLGGFILGLGQGIVDAAMNLYFAENFSPRLMNWLHASFGLGAALGPLLMTTLFALEQSWQWGYVSMSVLQAVIVVALALTLPRWRLSTTTVAADDRANIVVPSLMASLRQPLVWLSIALFFAFTGLETTAGVWSFTLLTEARALDEITAGQWASLYWWSFTLGRILFGFIADRTPIVPAIRVLFILVVLGSALFAVNLSNIVSFVGLALIGFALAPIFPLLITNTPQRLGPGHATNAIGFQIGAASLSIAALPALAGFLAEATSLEIIGPYLMVIALIALGLFLMLQRF
jgi:fucose permease